VTGCVAARGRQRAVRTARLQAGARRIGDYIRHPQGAMADLRNAVMRPLSQEDRHVRLERRDGGTGPDTGMRHVFLRHATGA